MKTYRILRDNKETGPFPYSEMQSVHLLPDDLIWVEGESSKWHYASELEELKEWVHEDAKSGRQKDGLNKNIERVFVSLPAQKEHDKNKPHKMNFINNGPVPAAASDPVSTTPLADYFPVKEQEETVQNFRFENKFQRNSTIWIAALFIGLIFSAFVVRKVVDGFSNNASDLNLATATAIPVESPKSFDNEPPATEDYQNALSTEVVVPAHHILVKKTKLKPLSSLVNIKSTPYKVGVFGGVSNLSFKVVNRSEFTIDNVSIEVQFLKPNGKILKTEIYDVNSIAAKSAKVLSVPPSSRGVKVKYHITSIKSKERSKLLNA